MTHLFLFTLPSVQSFIAQARKTQDLWAGSRIVSDLIGKVFDKIISEKGIVIFPNEKTDSLPNRILAEFNFLENTDLKAKGNEIALVVADELDKLKEKALDKIKNDGGDITTILTAFENQLKNYFSIFWVFVPFAKETYPQDYDNADRLLGAVKNTRTFTQKPEQGRKCSLSGEQNALVFNQDTLPSYVYNATQINTNNIVNKEGLSAISFIKRFYPFSSQQERFDSTTDISLLKDIENIPKDLLEHYKSQFQESYFDEQLFFEENLTVRYFEKNGLKKLLPDINGKKNIKKSILDGFAKLKKQLKTKYYAILLFDADSMGKWLSGDYLSDKKQLYDFHKHLSLLLSCFANYAKNYVDGNLEVKKQKGKTVYAGGDDYLGFINLHYLFEVIKHLREQFKEQVNDKISNSNKFQIKENKEMTFSAGISIAHYKTPLSEVLTWARKMEKEAKDTDNKDSFGVAVLKKSGEIRKAVLPFKDSNNHFFTEKIKTIINSLGEKFSNKFIKNLEIEMSLIADSNSGRRLEDDILDILNFEIERLTKRANVNASDADLKQLQSSISEILKISNKTKQMLSFDSPVENFNNTLSVCDFINRKLQGND